MNKEERIEKLKKFTQDPDWSIMVDLLKGHVAPLVDITSIDPRQSNEEIAAEVRGRQLTISSLTKFLNDIKVISGNIINADKPTFK